MMVRGWVKMINKVLGVKEINITDLEEDCLVQEIIDMDEDYGGEK